MNSAGGKDSVLKEILQIERKIKSIKSNPTYRQIRRNIDILHNRRIGNRNLLVPLPEDMEKKVQVRIHSEALTDIIQRYEKGQVEFKEQLEKLLKRRRDLKRALFR
jgi:hypothetical protein